MYHAHDRRNVQRQSRLVRPAVEQNGEWLYNHVVGTTPAGGYIELIPSACPPQL
jgi:hypothetical protein